MTLQALGVKARSFMGWQLVRASGVHGNARVEAVESAMLDEALSSGTVAVIPGFQGVSADGRVATLGRGGSDTSAVAIAAAVKADRCDIYTDVDGVYTTDPRIVPRARKLNQVTFEEMLELAGVGAKVLQVRSVGLAMRENLPLRVLSAFEDEPGTDIVAELSGADMERNLIAGIAADRNEARVTLTAVPDARHGGDRHQPACRGGNPGRHDRPRGDSQCRLLGSHLHRPARQPRPGNGRDRTAQGRDPLLPAVDRRCGRQGQHCRRWHPLQPELAARMFEVLAERTINLLAVSTSEIKVSALIAEDQLDLAVRVLHTAFGLDAEQAA